MPAKPSIIADPLTNRGTAFTEEERRRLGLIGRFPSAVETLDQQATRTYAQLTAQLTNLDKYVFLDQLHNRNEVLYYRVLADHLSELLPIVYDPTVGEAIKKWSRDYRRSRAVYLSVDRIEDVRPSLEGLCLGPDDVDLLVVSDAEEILGIGDWGVNGTGAIVIAAVVSGMKVAGQGFADQRLVVYGAGTAGTGMADQIHAGMVRDGLSPDEARSRIWLIDRAGLVTDDMEGLPDYQQAYARPASEVADWTREHGRIGLLETVRRVHPTILIGTSTDHGAFTREVIEEMSSGVERPIVLPLSNPTERIEAMPADIIAWSGGKALVATGIPVEPFEYEGTTFTIGQGNNALLYPGLGLGVIISGASRVTDGMLLAAAQAVANQVDPTSPGASLLPPVENLRASSATVAVAVARQAEADGVATASHDNLIQAVQDAMWQPVYPEVV